MMAAKKWYGTMCVYVWYAWAVGSGTVRTVCTFCTVRHARRVHYIDDFEYDTR